MRVVFIVIAVPVILVAAVAVLAAGGNDRGDEPRAQTAAALKTDAFDEDRAWRWLERQVKLGPRPAGSAKSRRLAGLAKDAMPRGRFQSVPGGLRNVTGFVPGKDRGRYVVVGAHYDTKDIPKFVGANDGASGTAAVLELARALKPGTIGPGVRFVLFDGEESPRGTPDSQFERKGLRGSRVAARAYHDAEAMILLDFVGDKRLRTPREGNSSLELWNKLRAAARVAGATRHFPDETAGAVLDDHVPFLDRGVPSIDLIDFDFACFHRTCDDLTAVSKASLDATGETVAGLLRTL